MLTVLALLDRNVAQTGHRPAILDAAGDLSWTQFRERVAVTAGALAGLGVKRGETFGVLMRNSARCFELLHAGYWLGAIPVPINFRLAPPEIAAVLEHAKVRVVAVETLFVDFFAHAALAPWKDALVCADATHAACRWSDEALMRAAQAVDPIDAQEDDVAILLYTGGTTGRSKGVPLTHKNIVSNALQAMQWIPSAADDVYLHVAPMFHSADLLATEITLPGGAHAFLPAFTPAAFMQAVERYRVTRCMLAPAMITAMLADESIWKHDSASLRVLLYGSSPMTVPAIKRTLERLPHVQVTQGYGLTETSPLLTLLTMDDHRVALREGREDRLHGCGRALPGVDMRIVDGEGKRLPAGKVGEVWVRGPNVTRGYLDNDAENRRAFAGGWFRTGDLGVMDEEGFVTLLDRAKDMIITGGENVYSIEVESVVALHPAVAEAAVIGVPDERFGEALVAIVVLKAGASLTVEALIEHCREHIGGYKIPRRLRIVPALPRSALGKVLKAELRQAARGA